METRPNYMKRLGSSTATKGHRAGSMPPLCTVAAMTWSSHPAKSKLPTVWLSTGPWAATAEPSEARPEYMQGVPSCAELA